MNLEQFRASLNDAEPPAGLSLALQALWYAGKGDWHGAHEEAQRGGDRDSAWVHAHLHREEGDHGNAAYWYSRAGRTPSDAPLAEEWRQIAEALLAR